MASTVKSRCPVCGVVWGGFKPEHCRACHETFGGTTAGDKHRVGAHAISVGPDRRRCLSAAEMIKAGLHQDAAGIWRTEAPAAGFDR